MVKTKRTFARTAVLASAALALSARGADANNWNNGGGVGDLFGNGETPNCNLLWFHTPSGMLMDYASGSVDSNAEQGRAVNAGDLSQGATNGLDDLTECETAPGFYLSTQASDGTDSFGYLGIEKAPVGWYAPGGQLLTTGTAQVVASTSLDPAFDSTTEITVCTATFGTNAAANSITSAAGSSAATDCVTAAGYYVSIAATSSGDDETIAQATAGTYIAGGTQVRGAAVETPTACPFGGNSAAGSSALTDCAPVCTAAAFDVDGSTGNCHCAAGYYGTADGTTTDGTGCDACPFGGNSAAGSSALTDCAPVCTAAAFDVDGSTGNCHCAAGYYGTADGTTTDGTGCDACPFGGTTLTAGSSALTDCAPDCATTNTNSGAVANGGTCECAANYYGSPLDAGGVTTAAASTGCTACSAGTTSTAGTTASSGCTGASPTAASPTAADSAGASTPIAVALAAAAAVPLLL